MIRIKTWEIDNEANLKKSTFFEKIIFITQKRVSKINIFNVQKAMAFNRTILECKCSYIIYLPFNLTIFDFVGALFITPLFLMYLYEEG